VNNKMAIAQEEIFGPVIVMIAYGSVDEALEIANDSPYGLSSGVWAGSVDAADFNYDAPLGGYKQSGNGREWGDFGIHEFYEVKSLQLPA
jgi:aldehyde dehydrogenase (NAD+)